MRTPTPSPPLRSDFKARARILIGQGRRSVGIGINKDGDPRKECDPGSDDGCRSDSRQGSGWVTLSLYMEGARWEGLMAGDKQDEVPANSGTQKLHREEGYRAVLGESPRALTSSQREAIIPPGPRLPAHRARSHFPHAGLALWTVHSRAPFGSSMPLA
jgi:hypothetical protein